MIRRLLALALLAPLGLGAGPAAATADGPDHYRVTAGEPVALRAGPGTDHEALARIAPGTDGLANLGCRGGLDYAEWERATEDERAEAAAARWCRVGYARQVGWVRGEALGEGAGPDAFDAGGPLGSLAGSEWEVVSFAADGPLGSLMQEGFGAPQKPEGWIRFTADGASGKAFCNGFTGGYAFDRGALSFGPVAATKKMCLPWLVTLENRFLAALGATGEAVAHHLVLALFDGEGRLLVTLARRDAD